MSRRFIDDEMVAICCVCKKEIGGRTTMMGNNFICKECKEDGRE